MPKWGSTHTQKSLRENFEKNREWQKREKKLQTLNMKNEMVTRNLKTFQTFNDKFL